MGISYGLDLATDFSVKVRDMFMNEDNHHLLRTRLNRNKLKVDRFLTTEGGGVTAAGVGGIITGRGADYLFIDDYIKNAEAALSETQKEKDWEWFKSTAYTRLEPNGSIIILATRWAQDDLIGRCLTEMPEENWELINLPALAEQNDPLGREEGEALWPERYPREVLLRTKAALGNYWWQAMYQQNPLPSMSGADLGDKLRIIREGDLPHYSNLKYCRSWDLAATQGGGDYTAGPKMAYCKDTGKIYVLDMQRFQKSPYGVEQMVGTIANHDGYGVPVHIEQEPGSAGVIVAEHYTSDVLKGFSCEFTKATGPIEVRAQPYLAAVEAGLVYVLDGDYVDDMKMEHNGFPDGKNDDQITALAQGYHKLTHKAFGGLTWGRKPSNVVPIGQAAQQHQRLTGVTW